MLQIKYSIGFLTSMTRKLYMLILMIVFGMIQIEGWEGCKDRWGDGVYYIAYGMCRMCSMCSI